MFAEGRIGRKQARQEVLRRVRRQLAFGLGAHFCLGAALARMQATVVLEYLLPHLRDLHIEEAVWREDVESRGLARLVVSRNASLA
jgi:cytochrome P450